MALNQLSLMVLATIFVTNRLSMSMELSVVVGLEPSLAGVDTEQINAHQQAFILSFYSSFSAHSTFEGADLQRIFFNNDIIFGS